MSNGSNNSMVITLRHEEAVGEEHLFVARLWDEGRRYEGPRCAVKLPSPRSIPVKRGDCEYSLCRGLEWYFNRRPGCKRASHALRIEERLIEAALRKWAATCFNIIFSNHFKENNPSLSAAFDNGPPFIIKIRVISKEPDIQSWPWEALCFYQNKIILRLERELSSVKQKNTDIWEPSSGPINILMATCRPGGLKDIDFSIISDKLNALGSKYEINLTVINPPTYESLEEKLEAPGTVYHIFHFDGHGEEGRLVFEDASGRVKTANNDKLIRLFQNKGILLAVLNACQSGIIGNSSDSAGLSLHKAGIPSVISMNYDISPESAVNFIASFYKRLFAKGSVCDAVHYVRDEIRDEQANQSKESSRRVETSLMGEWLVPTLYRKADVNLYVRERNPQRHTSLPQNLPWIPERKLRNAVFLNQYWNIFKKLSNTGGPRTFVLYGSGGIGKTLSLARFLRWCESTNSDFFTKICWLNFYEFSDLNSILDAMSNSLDLDLEKNIDLKGKVNAFIERVTNKKYLIIWDKAELRSKNGDYWWGTHDDRAGLDYLFEELHDKESSSSIFITNTYGLIDSQFHAPWVSQQKFEKFSYKQTLDYFNHRNRGLSLLDTIESKNVESRSYQDILPEIIKELEGLLLAIDCFHYVLKHYIKHLNRDASSLPWEEWLNIIKKSGEQNGNPTNGVITILFEMANKDQKRILKVVCFHKNYCDIELMKKILTEPNYHAALADCFRLLAGADLCYRNPNLPLGKDGYILSGALHEYAEATGGPSPEDRKLFAACFQQYAKDHNSARHETVAPDHTLHRANVHLALNMPLETGDDKAHLTMRKVVNLLTSTDIGDQTELYKRDEANMHQNMDVPMNKEQYFASKPRSSK